MRSAGIVGTGLYVPEEIRSNEWFKQFNLLSLNKIFDEAGVMERRICAKGEKSSDMEAKALLAAVENAGIGVKDIDLILDGPNIHDQASPGNAALLQYKSGASNAVAINVDTACISLISQLEIAWSLIAMGRYDTVACVVATMQTKTADYTDKSCMLLGDGAVAVIVQPVSEGKGILSVHLETEGRYFGGVGIDLRLPRSLMRNYRASYLESSNEKLYYFFDHGEQGLKEITKSGPVRPPEAAKKALAKAGYTEKDIDFLITHQPSKILTEAWHKSLRIPVEKTHDTIEKYGNMGPASMGSCLHEAVVSGKIKEGDLVVMFGPGAGFHYGGAVLRWGK
ncbi:3-oxoacyl-ACP synthase III family protein [Desulfonema magnum]|uniref:3-oxoacyl-[acyl-carrier-protein] synthase 3, FabH-like n=1 Tax=Desulfonema magnum TaxID=45655 RepID=A0A975GNT3_9BACT|nr:ketoacyl-ACP synthase III [Desulfonema magnum]QTA87193.1 Putative 3-oxoacyl-[acyl-carrier-protein] synthase 3, FabH-like [Desulfonema magnum]